MIARAVFGIAALIATGAVAASGGGGVKGTAITASAYPATLAEYGFFADVSAQKPAARVTPYRLNTPLWSDGAEKLRFVYLPPGAKAKANGEGLLDLPVGAALIKTFAFGTRKMETRVLLHRAEGCIHVVSVLFREAGVRTNVSHFVSESYPF